MSMVIACMVCGPSPSGVYASKILDTFTRYYSWCKTAILCTDIVLASSAKASTSRPRNIGREDWIRLERSFFFRVLVSPNSAHNRVLFS